MTTDVQSIDAERVTCEVWCNTTNMGNKLHFCVCL
jgi:hypothetical protein